MTVLFLVLLALAWMAVFVPAAVRARQQAPAVSTERFKRGLGMLAVPARNRGRWIITPGAWDRAKRRRVARLRRVFVGLLIAAGASLVLATVGVVAWSTHLFADALLGSFVVMLIALKRQEEEAARKVARIHRDEDEPVIHQRAVGDDLEFHEPPGSLLEPYESLEPPPDSIDFEFHEAVRAGGSGG